MDYLVYILSIATVALLAAGWAGVQVLARRQGTRNHIDNASSCCNGCGCFECERESCSREKESNSKYQY